MAQRPKVSVILATYTGIELIDRCLESIRIQHCPHFDLELIAVVDGPNEALRDRIETHRQSYEAQGSTFEVHMFEKNRGRFAAQQYAAENATGEWVIIMGDRIALPENYVSDILSLDEPIVIPDVEEVGWDKNIINTFMHQVRHKLFSKKSRLVQRSYIDAHNFEQTPKGNGGMLISRGEYLAACSAMNGSAEDKNVSDDTKMLRVLVDDDKKLCRSNEVSIDYLPRSSFPQQVHHLFERGPRFVDYYIRPRTRFHLLLLAILFGPPVAIATVIALQVPLLFIAGAGITGVLLVSIALAGKPSHIPKLLIAVPTVGIVFYFGVLRGFLLYVLARRNLSMKSVVSALILILTLFLFAQYILSNRDQFNIVGSIHWPMIALIVVANFASLAINGVFMKIVLKPFGKEISLIESFYVSVISSMGNFFAPGGTGIGIRGVYLKKKHQVKYSDFLNTVAGNYVIVFFVISLGGLISLLAGDGNDKPGFFVLLMVFAGLFIIDLALILKPTSRLMNRIIEKMPARIPGRSIVLRIFEGWDLLTSHVTILFKLLGLSAVGYGVSLATNYLILSSLKIDIEFSGLMLLVALSSISIFINLTPGNIGIREAVLLASSQLIGLTTAQTISFSIVDRTILFCVLFIGWIATHTIKSMRAVTDLVEDEPRVLTK